MIIPLWENIEFVEIYVSKAKHIYTNLNVKSYIKNSCWRFDDYVKITMNILNNHSYGAMNLLKTFKVAKLI